MRSLFYCVAIAQLLFAHVINAQTNAQPIVSAGTDKKLTLTTTTVTLTGTASDPDGTITTYSWTKVKGPSATLTNMKQPTLTVTNLKKGIYTFRLTVSDNSGTPNGTAYDEVIVIYDQSVKKTHAKGSTPENQMYYWEYLPEDYATSNASKKYPLILFLHGCGERSYTSNCNLLINTPFDSTKSYNELDKVQKFGPLEQIAGGTKMCFKNPSGVEECFIIISPQLNGRTTINWTAGIIQDFLNTLFATYTKIDKSRVYLTGFSLGGIGTYGFAQSTQPTAASLAAIAPVAGRGNVNNACILKNNNVPVWAFHGDRDTRVPYASDKELIENLTRCNPTPLPRFTVYAGRGHDSFVFSTPYKTVAPDPNYPETLYEWFLKYKKSNIPPVVNAGSDGTITLPTNSIRLNGAASDADGISSYAWTKQSGPAATLLATNQASITVSNMVAGLYVFRLTVTDTKGGSSFDEVSIRVNPSATGGSWIELTTTNVPGRSVSLYYSLPKDNSNQVTVRPGNNFLEFYVKKISGTTDPKFLRIEIVVRFITSVLIAGDYIEQISPTWTKVRIPLDDFPIDPTRWTTGGVSLVKFKVLSGFNQGVFGLDEIHFTGGPNPVVWYGDTHQVSGSSEVVVDDPAFFISNRFTNGGAPVNSAGSSSARLSVAEPAVDESTETIKNALAEGNVVHIYTMQGYKVDTFICPVNCSITKLSEITDQLNQKGLYILRVESPSGKITTLKVNMP